MKIENLPLPKEVLDLLKNYGLIDLYPPQADAIREGVLDGDNMLLACPTASGKTLIAELAMLKHILEWNGKVIYLVPLKALASEKKEEFQKYEQLGIKTIVSTGDFDTKDQWLKNFDIIICSNEKADSLLRHQVSWMKDISLIVSDEVHLITDPSRGPTLEVALSKLRQINPNAQILALSATIKNANEVAEWLNAKLILSEWRPVILREGIYYNGEIEFKDGQSEEISSASIQPEKSSKGKTTARKRKKKKTRHTSEDPMINLLRDMLHKNGQMIVFTNTRKSTMSLASKLARSIPDYLTNEKKDVLKRIKEEILSTGADTSLRARLAQSVLGGVAFHHAGMDYRHRRIVEAYFKDKLIFTICATPTLCLSPETKIWHGIFETKVTDFKISNPLFALSQNKLIPIKASQVCDLANFSPLIEISSVSGYSIRVTPNHKMQVKRNNKPIIIPAYQIVKTDKIATIGKLCLKETNCCNTNDFLITNKPVVTKHKIDNDLSYFIGLMLGDGYSGAETKGGSIYYKGSPAIVGLDNEIFSHVEKVCHKLNISCRQSTNSFGTPTLILGKNKWFREFLVRCGVEKGDQKYINSTLMKMNLDNTSYLLCGLFDSDGYVHKGARNIGFSNTSEKLVKQVKKLLLRFGIVSRLRKREGSSITLHEKEYETKPQFELIIAQRRCLLDFHKYIGFNVLRKQKELSSLIAKIKSNVLYVSCSKCEYKIFRSLFSGRTERQKEWGKLKRSVICLLGKNGELGSNEIEKILGKKPRKKENRLNHHYELINKRKIGRLSKTEWFWSLNAI
ncbi:MAG: DEAD/DEAH box helicase, partial [Candidatus Sifarchaeia archaeon]